VRRDPLRPEAAVRVSKHGVVGENAMKRSTLVLGALAIGLSVSLALAEDVTLESVPPVVVKTIPEAGTGDVDPKLTEIKVTFSKDMQDGTWSWAMISEASFPKLDGKPKYLADKRTAVLPVKLEPGKTYAIWVNSGEKFNNFKDAAGRPAVPYLLVFKTKK
jgi:RNA polymerase sigma-70 factor (ECF subfamily)